MLRGVFLRGIYLSQPSTLSPISSFSPHLSQRFGSTNRKKDQQQQQKTKKEEGKEKEKPKGGGSRRLTALPYNWKVEGIAPHLMVPSVPFSSLSVSEKMREGLKSCGFETATDIQKLAIPYLIKNPNQNAIIGSQTGTGKSLSFLVPLMHKLKKEEEEGGYVPRARRPRALVISPTVQLAQQTIKIIKQLTHFERVRATLITSSMSHKRINEELQKMSDIVVTTPGTINQARTAGEVFFSDLRVVVMDEADTLFDPSFSDLTMSFLTPLQQRYKRQMESYQALQNVLKTSPEKTTIEEGGEEGGEERGEGKEGVEGGEEGLKKPMPVQFVFVGATLSKELVNYVDKEFPSSGKLMSPQLHKGISSVQHVFCHLLGSQKHTQLFRILSSPSLSPSPSPNSSSLPVGGGGRGSFGFKMKNGDVEEEGEMKGALGKRKRGGGGVLGGGESMIVFCNTVGCCRSLDHTLREWGVKPSHYHSKMPRALQKEEYEKFLSGRTNILLTTDLASRGLDTTNVKHIINFDFPRSPIDYLHRSGRTGRMNTQGRVINFVTKGDEKIAGAVQEAVQKGDSLSYVGLEGSFAPGQKKKNRWSDSKKQKMKDQR